MPADRCRVDLIKRFVELDWCPEHSRGTRDTRYASFHLTARLLDLVLVEDVRLAQELVLSVLAGLLRQVMLLGPPRCYTVRLRAGHTKLPQPVRSSLLTTSRRIVRSPTVEGSHPSRGGQ